jgi:acyl-coenzyme A thioesterase PaaI-like protein
MKGRIHEYHEGSSIKIAFPVEERFTNPAGFLLGGKISAYFDNTFGPFSLS